jgi:hypothetical protein
MRRAAAAFALVVPLVLLAANVNVAAAQDMELAVPRALRAGETAWIEVEVGPVGRGQEVEVKTASGQPLGTISPFGVRLGQAAGTYSLPVPPDAIRDNRLPVRVTITQPGGPPRAPTAQEVRSVKLRVGGAQ